MHDKSVPLTPAEFVRAYTTPAVAAF